MIRVTAALSCFSGYPREGNVGSDSSCHSAKLLLLVFSEDQFVTLDLMDHSIHENTMETIAEHSCDSTDTSQSNSSCSCDKHDLPNKKRQANSLSDEGSSLAKYRKCTETRVTTAMAEDTAAHTRSMSDISSEEFCNSEGNNNNEKNTSNNTLTELSEACKFNCINNDHISAIEKCEKYLCTTSESDGDSLNVSPQKDIKRDEITLPSIDNIINKKHMIIQKLALISSAAKFHRSVIQTSQFSCNDKPEESTKENNLQNTSKQGNSQISNSNCNGEMQQEITNTEISYISVHEEIIPGTSSEIADAYHFNGQYVDQENNMKDLLSDAPFTDIADTSDKNSSDPIAIKQNDSILVDFTIQPRIGEQNNVDNSTGSQNYIEDSGISDQSSHFYSSENLHQSSNTKATAEQNINPESNRENLDINLAELVLSLRQDIQLLIHKVEKQENILDTLVNVNNISVAPLFSQSFPEKYNLKVPFNTIEEFDKFNRDLAKDEKFCNEFITSLCSYIDNHVTFTKNIMAMLKIYMTKELLSLYTASKATPNKMVLKETRFCQCLLQATRMTIKNDLLPLEHEKAFMKNLGLVLNGAKTWNTHRQEKN